MVLITFHFLKGTLWRLDYSLRSLLNFPTDDAFPFGCFREKTDSGYNACLPGKKYGNPFIFKLLCTDCKRVNCENGETYCLTTLLTRHNYWRPSIIRMFCVGVFLLFFWGFTGISCLYGLSFFLPNSFQNPIQSKIKHIASKIAIRKTDSGSSERDEIKALKFFESANKLVEEKKFEEALLEFRNSAKSNPKDPNTFFSLAKCYLALNREVEALEAFTRSNSLNGTNWLTHKHLSKLFMKFGLIDKAMEHARIVLALRPQAVEGHLLRGACHLQKDEIQEATREIEIAKSILDKFPQSDTPENYLFCAHLFYLLEKYEVSKEFYNKALEIHPGVEDGHIGLASVFAVTRKFDQAMAELKKVLEKDPENIKALLCNADIEVLKGKHHKAIETLQSIQKLASTNKKIKMKQAEIYLGIGEANQGYKILKEIIEEDPNEVKALLLLTTMYITKGLYAQAIEYAERVRAINHQNIHGNILLIKAYLGQKDFIKAITIVEEFILQYPKNFELLFLLASANQQAGKKEKAIKIYKKTIEYHPSSLAAHLNLAGLFYENGQLQMAVNAYQKVLELSPNHPIASNNLAMLLLEIEKGSNEAMEMAIKLHEQYPQNPFISDTLGWAYFHSDENDKALELLDHAANMRPESPAIHYHLAAVLHKKGLLEEAHKSIKKALKLSNKFTGVAQAQKLLEEIEKKLE